MASPDFPEPPPSAEPTPISEVDAAVDELYENRQQWVELSLEKRIDLLESCLETTAKAAEPWVEEACRAKGIDSDSPQAGEEWLGGPMTLARNIRLLVDALENNGAPRVPEWKKGPRGETVAQIFPYETSDKIFYGGIRAEVWFELGDSPSQGRIYREKRKGISQEGGVALVLGAGNVASIGPMDTLYKLFVDDEVVIIKTNPVNAYLGEHWAHALRPLVDQGFVRIVHGGADVGAHLTYHDKIASIHITGSNHTHDAIVWGADEKERERRMAEDDPKLDKPISSELGAVTPVFVVPGAWSSKQMDYQARHVASMVANNASFNCNAAKMLVVASGWNQREEFIQLVREKLSEMPPRKAYYPGAENRYEGFLDNYPQAIPLIEDNEEIVPWTVIPDVPPEGEEYALCNEAFCGVLAEVTLDADNAEEFIEEMVRFGNEEAWGTLSCMILIDPKTEKAHKDTFEDAIASLEYGGIGINAWAGVIYALVNTTWGAFPGHSLKDIQSGRGVVHNTFMFDRPQKSVVRAPFKIFPTPPWFTDHKTVHTLGRKITEFETNPSVFKIPGIVATALRG